MIVPSIDIQNGRAVQLVGGKELKVDAGDPKPIARRFCVAGELAVIDLDAAMGVGDNTGLMRELVRTHDCRVGGGIRSVQAAIEWLDAGATQIILGTAATPELLRELPRDRVIAALDAVHGEVVVEGWTKATGRNVLDRIAELREYAGGFLVTFVEREGRMVGLPEEEIAAVVDAAGQACRVTVAGGVATANDVATADGLGADCQVGMALYTGAMRLGDAVASVFTADRDDGLIPTVVCDEHRRLLGQVYSSRASIAEAVDKRSGVYFSRSRGELWHKGKTSGQTQRLLRVEADCDRDAACFIVQQQGGKAPGAGDFCHLARRSCFGQGAEGGGLPELSRTLLERIAEAPEGSYTKRLANDPDLLRAKLHEEADELCEASRAEHVAAEAADVLYFALARAAAAGVDLSAIERELDLRARRVSRRSTTEVNSTSPRATDVGTGEVMS